MSLFIDPSNMNGTDSNYNDRNDDDDGDSVVDSVIDDDPVLPSCVSPLMKPTGETIYRVKIRCKEMMEHVRQRQRERWDRLVEEHEQSTSSELASEYYRHANPYHRDLKPLKMNSGSSNSSSSSGSSRDSKSVHEQENGVMQMTAFEMRNLSQSLHLLAQEERSGSSSAENGVNIAAADLHPLHHASHVGGFVKMIDGYLFRAGNEIVAERPDTGDRYIGTFNIRGRYHGHGEIWYRHSSCYYRGQFQNGKRHGYGIMVMRDGKFYEGQFENDQRSGEGTFYWSDGRVYRGFYKNDEKCGRGVHVWTTTSSFFGHFFNNLRSGFGIYRWHTGKIFFGYYSSDRRHGNGITFYPNAYPEAIDLRLSLKAEKWIRGEYAHGKPKGVFFCVMQDQMPYLTSYDDQGYVKEYTLWCMPRLQEMRQEGSLCDIEIITSCDYNATATVEGSGNHSRNETQR